MLVFQDLQIMIQDAKQNVIKPIFLNTNKNCMYGFRTVPDMTSPSYKRHFSQWHFPNQRPRRTWSWPWPCPPSMPQELAGSDPSHPVESHYIWVFGVSIDVPFVGWLIKCWYIDSRNGCKICKGQLDIIMQCAINVYIHILKQWWCKVVIVCAACVNGPPWLDGFKFEPSRSRKNDACLSAPSTNYDIQVQTHYGQSCLNRRSIQNSLNTWLHCNPSKQRLRLHYCLIISCFKNSHLSMRPRTPMAKMLSTLVRLYSSTMICGITPMIHRMPQGISCHAGLLENYWWHHGRHGWLPVKRMQRYPWNDKIQMWLPETLSTRNEFQCAGMTCRGSHSISPRARFDIVCPSAESA